MNIKRHTQTQINTHIYTQKHTRSSGCIRKVVFERGKNRKKIMKGNKMRLNYISKYSGFHSSPQYPPKYKHTA